MEGDGVEGEVAVAVVAAVVGEERVILTGNARIR
jgi:hypothetical protein